MMRVALLVLLCAALTPPPAGATLCRTRKGKVVERAACKKREAAVNLAAVGVAVPGDPGATGASHPRLRAFDATGRPIGFLDGGGDVLFVHGTRAFYVRANGNGFPRARSLYYESPGCTGPPFVFADGALVARGVVVGTTAYVAGEPIETRTLQSVATETPATQCASGGGTFDSSTQSCCSAGPFEYTVAPAVAVDLGGFVPPFRVEIER